MGFVPETSGKLFHGSAGLELATAHKLNMATASQSSLFGSVSPTTVDTEKSLESTGSIALKGEMGLLPFIDYVFKRRTESPSMHGLKLQFFGDSFLERKPGFKAAVIGLYGESIDNETGSFSISIRDTASNDEFDDMSANIKMTQRQAGLLLGHRINNWLMLYQNSFYSRMRSKATLTINSVDHLVYAITEMYSLSLGLKFNIGTKLFSPYFTIEHGRSKAKVTHGPKETIDIIEFTAGVNW